jgi:dTDP-N-acetylfucosamine:lipid II N-acetylfucosaminyltransferase
MIVHIVTDCIFANMALNEFELNSPNENVAFVIGSKELLNIKFNKTHFVNHESFNETLAIYPVNACVFHSLDGLFFDYILKIPKEIKVVWFGWGFDYYQTFLNNHYPGGLISLETRKVIFNKTGLISNLLFSIKKYLENFKPKKKIYKRIDFFAPVLKTEYSLILRYNPWFTAKFLDWNYGTVEDDFFISQNIFSEHKIRILVGNSATPENNHVNILHGLYSRTDMLNKEIIAPLNYGNSDYGSIISDMGKELFQDGFIPIINLMTQKEYSHFICSCEFVFMGHLRQQALGNICILMINGSKIYLNPINPLYTWFLNLGAFIYPLDFSKISNDLSIFEPLSISQKEKNKDIIYSIWGKKSKSKRTNNVINILNSSI